MQWRRPQGSYTPFGEAALAAKGDTTAGSKVGVLDKSSAREAVSTNSGHVREGDWHTLKRTNQIALAGKAASAEQSAQPTQRASVIDPSLGMVSLDVESDDDHCKAWTLLW